MHRKLIDLTSRNRALEYGDPLTGVGNRRLFTVRYEEFVRSHDATAEGCAVAVRLCGIAEANRRIGYEAVNRLIVTLAQEARRAAEGVDDAVVCRISGMEIALLLPGTDEEVARERGEGIVAAVRAHLENQSEAAAIMCLVAAVAPYGPGRTLSELLASLDLALNDGERIGADTVKTTAFESRLPTRKTQWRAWILDAIAQKRLIPKLRNIFSENGRDVSAALQLDLQTEEGETIPYRVYAPMLLQLDLFPRYVRYLLEYLLTDRTLRCDRVFVEFPMAYLDTTHHFETLLSFARKLEKSGRQLVVELGQNDLLRREPAALSAIAEELTKRGIALAVVRFDAEAKMLERLHLLRPAFVRIDVTQYLDMSETLRDSLGLLLRSIGARLLVSGVQNPMELERLEETGGEYFVV
jgi:GGDEF domain-containing protein/EAL domain-containing protein (putative c-di-GMP-specific phosphodiesterase class I)